jgi:hypothetical protein
VKADGPAAPKGLSNVVELMLGYAAAEAIGMPVAKLLAPHMHDIGKLKVPSEFLAKPGRITPLEYELIKGHAQAGAEILEGIEFPWPLREMVWQHHERMDGTGYPRGFQGAEILLEAQIIGVADVSSDRVAPSVPPRARHGCRDGRDPARTRPALRRGRRRRLRRTVPHRVAAGRRRV